MATKLFLDFDVSQDGAIGIASMQASRINPLLPAGVALGGTVPTTTVYTKVGRTSASGSYCGPAATNSQNTLMAATMGVNVTRASLGSPSELWVTFDVNYDALGNVVGYNDTGFIGTSDGNCLFQWGDVRIRLFGCAASTSGVSGEYDLKFRVYNGATTVDTITVPQVTVTKWLFVQIHVKLDASTGLIDLTVETVSSASYTGQNTVATTSLASATSLYVTGSCLGKQSGSPSGYWQQSGLIDNVLIDDAGFPSGRPRGERMTLASDDTNSGFTITGNSTLYGALGGTGTIEGSGGSYGLINLTSYSVTGLEADLIGFRVYVLGATCLDFDLPRKLSAGISLSGTATMGSVGSATLLPTTPSTTSFCENIFVKTGGGGLWQASEVASIKARIEVP